MNLEIRHLRLIVTISEQQSVTKAGERLHLTQSALSHQLRDIEERLGTPLFHRLNKRMVLTQAGERLLQSARQVLQELERAEDDLAQIAAGEHGSLRLSTECYTCYHWLPEMLKQFRRRYPQVEVRIVVEATRHPIQALLDGLLDFAIVSTTERDKRIRYQPLFQDELVVIMAPHHPLTSRPYIRARDFADQQLFLYASLSESTIYQRLLLPAGVTPAQVSQMQLTEAIVEMVSAGMGISTMARWAVAKEIASGKIAARPLTRKGLQRQWSAALLRNDYTPPYVTEFIELLSSRALPVTKPGPQLRACNT